MMNMISVFKQQVCEVLEQNILRFWIDRMQDREHGGFYGRMDGKGVLCPKAEKGAVLNARLLWTFAASYRVLSQLAPQNAHLSEYKKAALRAKEYILQHFIDREHGGIYWSVDYLGQPLDMKKQSYAQGFMIYGMSELTRATGDREALRCAIDLFCLLEEHAYDRLHMGYIEALTRDWLPISDMRLSDKDENGSRTMNTHLHILEPYTNLYRVWKDERLERQLRRLISIFTEKLINARTHHLDLFFDDEWQGLRNIESYGHDIEAAWLLTEALEVLGDDRLMQDTMPVVRQIAMAAEEGLTADGAMIHERKFDAEGALLYADNERHWWVQCENVIGQLNMYQHFHDEHALHKALQCWEYIRRNLIDYEHGEWYWSRSSDGTVNSDEDKAGFWKCPYHNSRMCLEVLESFSF